MVADVTDKVAAVEVDELNIKTGAVDVPDVLRVVIVVVVADGKLGNMPPPIVSVEKVAAPAKVKIAGAGTVGAAIVTEL